MKGYIIPMVKQAPPYCQVLISSPTKAEIEGFTNILVKNRLVAGCMLISGLHPETGVGGLSGTNP